MDADLIVSTTVRGNKIIAIYYSLKLYFRVRIFEIKEGTTSDIFNSGKTFDFGHDNQHFVLDHLDIPDSLQEGKNKLWLRFGHGEYPYDLTTYSFMNWAGYINLDDMSLRNDSSFIKFPTDKNFPVRRYKTNIITNKFGSALYVTGGEIYSKKVKDFTAINSFYKYNFTSREWADMTYTTVGKLKPLFDHNSVIIDNRYLVILGGERQIYNSTFNFNGRDRPEYEHNTLYNLTIFDTLTNKWDNVNVDANIFDASISKLKFELFIATVYKDKIIVLGGTSRETKSNRYNFNSHIGILDFKYKIWNWFPILNEDGSNYATVSNFGSIQVLNDQLIICSSKLNFIINYFY
ncbi:hypothetical protein CONCODRAFT_111884 [Conidiobolus coronatus NRRL 28638]|uniref:Galactose oxidase n=1 Tax=Conidiobolus coronatus (strain ATCC 28846 / CBS 209.66 / NRRL 28638) TaxID=796925 RepID=A0A137PIP8_CONC2|nr:hypothetical protein CONCODRAFT_111884 [Conidiobolus coronatus NRRL 28638]|eukprot:KXN74855.1 hypothetical protein CONCODRAFT_111884 [Conidiobolus coronatus NRRL 28638]